MIPRTFPSSVASNGSTQMIVYFLPSVSGLTRWVDYIPVKFTTVATAATENTYNQNGYIPVVSISSIAGATPFKEYVPVFLDSSAADAEVWKVNITGFIPVGTAGIGGAALYMDFAATTTLDPRVTFSRTTNATLTNSAGLVANAPMNLLTFSEQFDNAAWAKTRATVTANALAAPEGAASADKLISSAGLDSHFLTRSVTSAVMTLSVFAKQGEFTHLKLSTSAHSFQASYFNLSTGEVAQQGANHVAAIADAGDGWYRCSITPTDAFNNIYIENSGNSAAATHTGDGVSGIYIWGAQLELGSTATTYNPTTVKNLLGFTEHFDNAAWTKSNASISATKVDDIYGQPFAQKLVENTANASHLTVQTLTMTAGTYTASVYAKAGERTQFGFSSVNGRFPGANFDLVALTATVIGATSAATITDVGGGWYRCTATRTVTAGAEDAQIRLIDAAGNTSYTGDGTSGIYIFGAQLSDSASVDPYVYNPVAAPSSVAYYGPRFDYDPVTLAPKGLLIEEQRTNLLTRSEEFDNAVWTKDTGSAVTANAITAPDGTVTAELMYATIVSTVNQRGIYQGTSWAINTAYSFSVYAKKGTSNFLALRHTALSGAPFAWFNLNTGVIGTVQAGLTASIQSVGNGWYRCSITGTTPGSIAVNRVDINVSDADNTSAVALNGGIYIWGAQLEAGAFATSYIPTVASQVTRAADSASMIGNNFARWYNQSAGTAYAEYLVNGLNPASSNAAYGISAGSTSDFITGRTASNQATNFAVRVGGADQVFLSSTTVAVGAVAKSAGAYTLNDFALSANAGTVQTDTAGTLPVVTQMQIGGLTSSTNPLNGTIKRITYYNRRLSNSELQAITS